MSDHLRNGTDIRQIDPPDLAAGPGYSHAVSVDVPGRLVVISGQVPVDADGALVGEGDLRAQLDQIFTNLSAALKAADATWHHVVRLGFFLRDIGQVATLREVRDRHLPAGVTPASTLVEVSGLVNDAFLAEIEAWAVVPRNDG
ncbi:RidA family protein [Actinomadura kijaniata]|uniref:Enamine deaminase RidA (YjgF/YER057c/UK114 family) n=1 Tax=Actinomadura namibiensis TaxID=182080 RepID=A0A7W3LS80_ACTNM|nr:RidA family protein [Actinomadura namibiensis]MBA8953330.1 enamine deaminase RidA (YjgF/YER057c/UK114 family) [Actinomadura namibiensis]